MLESLFDKVADVAAVLQKRESKNSNAFPLILKKKKKRTAFYKTSPGDFVCRKVKYRTKRYWHFLLVLSKMAC